MLDQHPTYRALQKALPASEFAAVAPWLACFFPFQLDWLLDWGQFSMLLKARQIGASHSYGAAALLWALLGDTTTVTSKGDREARELVFDKAETHAKLLVAFGSKWAETKRSGEALMFPHTGGRIIALPSSSGGRSFTGHVILDEFAYHEHPEMVWDGAAPSTSKGFRMRVLSTPNGTGNKFHELWTDPNRNRGWTKYATTLDEAVSQGYQVDVAACWTAVNNDPRVFDQAYRCKFLDGNQQYIPSALIDAATVDETAIWEGGVYYAGLDVGRKNDLTCLVIVGVDADGVHWVQVIETRKRTSEADLEALCALALGSQWRCQRVCIDATGIGAFPADNLQKQFGRQRIEPVNFTLQSKEDMATTLYQRLADKRLMLPRDARDLREDLASLRRIITSAGNVRYDAPTTDRGHADRAWALALALHACSKPSNRRHEEYA